LPFDRQDKEAKELSTRIIARALKSLNQYYKQPVLATAEEFKAAIDDVIRTTVKGMKPLFGKSEIVPEVAQ
jgi:translation elongation factor EF-Tu-like GTPase